MIARIRRWWHGRHHWDYRNPFNRTCIVCGRNEVRHCQDMSEFFDSTKGWWEVFNEGDLTKHHKERT